MAKVKVSREQGIALFKALGFSATDTWTDARLEVKLNALPKLQVAEKKVKDKTLKTLLTNILEAKEEDEEIVVGKSTKDEKPAKKGAKKPVDDDEDDEDSDEEDGDEEEDEEDDDEDAESEDEEDEDSDEEDEDEEDEVEVKPNFGVGDTVEHEEHGTCTVKKISKDGTTVTIEDADGEKHPGIDPDDLTPVTDEDEDSEDEDDSEEEDDTEDEDEDDEDSDDDSEEDEEDETESEDSDEEDEDETDDEEDEDMADEKPTATKKKGGKVEATKKGAEKPSKNGKPEKGKAPPKKAGKEGGPGIIGSIVEIMNETSEQKPITKDAILDKLCKRFGEDRRAAMKQTLNIQLPTRLRAEKGLNIERGEKGYYIVSKKAKKK